MCDMFINAVNWAGCILQKQPPCSVHVFYIANFIPACIQLGVNCVLMPIFLFTTVPREEFVPEDLCIRVGGSCQSPLPRNNAMQEEAIRKGLTGAFTPIQGPPGVVY